MKRTQKNQAKITFSQLEEACLSYMAAKDLPFAGPLKTNTTKFVRYSAKSNTKDKKDKPEWYIARDGISSRGNPYLICTFGSWRTGNKFTFNSWDNDQTVDAEEIKKLREAAQKAKEECDKLIKAAQDEAAKECEKIWNESKETPPSEKYTAYLELKDVKAYGIRYGKNENGYPALIIPIRNNLGHIRSLQYISVSSDGRVYKSLHTGGEVSGNYHVIGELTNGMHIHPAEGYSTAYSCYISIEEPVVVAFSAGNLAAVVKNLREKYPDSRITILADDDRGTESEGKGNPGRTAAEKAAKKPNCSVIYPQFPEGFTLPDGSAPTDFNDLHVHFGIDEVKRQIKENSNPVKEPKLPLPDDDQEAEDGADAKELIKARASARRRAVMQELSHTEIVLDLRKQFPTLKDQAVDIASKAIQWAEKHKPGCEVIVGGIPKKITSMKALDARFAQLEAPGQPCVIINRLDAQPISTKDFNQRLSGNVVLINVDDKGQPKYLPASAFWTGNTNKFIYKNIVFTNNPVDNNTYNLFPGFGVKPSNEGQCEKILAHIKEVICAGDEANYTAFIKLKAWQMQNIGKPSRIITVLKSKAQQTGKGTVLEQILAPIYGNAGFTTSDLGQIITRFNDTIRGKAFIFLDEALFSGDLKSADAIKSLATTMRLPIETKGLPTVQIPIAVNLFLTTNHDNAAHVEESDARYWILEVSPHRVNDHVYFEELYEEIENGGRAAFMHHLLNRDVKNFVPSRDVPIDNAFKDAMIRNSINPYDARKWLEACCENEMIIGLKPLDNKSQFPWEPWVEGTEYVNGVFSAAYSEWQKSIKSPVGARPTPSNNFGKLLEAAGLKHRNIKAQRRRKLPDPNKCLEIVMTMIDKIGK